ncbi:MAG: class I tRNA ligase family protein [Thiolinea sp.]
MLANLGDFDPAQHQVAPQDMLALDRWAVHQAAQVQKRITDAYARYQFHLVTQEIQKFCTVDMGSLFLDITKDRQYTMPADSLGRRSAQTAAYHILRAMLPWMYPVLSFTAEEILSFLPGEHEEAVLFMQWYDGLFELEADSVISAADWAQIFDVREAVSKQLEQVRTEGRIGAALSAEVDIYQDDKAALSKLGDELKFVFITSAVRLHDAAAKPEHAVDVMPGVAVVVEPSAQAKCVRCWHHSADVGSDAAHPELCGRCISNVEGGGESRHYA